MECREIRVRLHEWIDGELPTEARRHFQQHLDRCEECSRQVEAGMRLKKLVQSKAVREPLPANLQGRLREALAAERAVTPFAQRWGRGAAAAGLVALILPVTWYLFRETPLVHADFTEASLESHLGFEHRQNAQFPCQSLSMAPAAVKELLGVEIPLPEFDPEVVALKGISVKKFDGHSAAHLHYTWNGGDFSLFVVPNTVVVKKDGQPIVHGSQVCCCWREGDITVHCFRMMNTESYYCAVVREKEKGRFQTEVLKR